MLNDGLSTWLLQSFLFFLAQIHVSVENSVSAFSVTASFGKGFVLILRQVTGSLN